MKSDSGPSRERLTARARDARARTAYGLVLIVLSAMISFDLAAPDTRWAALVQTALGGAALGLTLVIAGAGRRISTIVAGVALAAVAVGVVQGVGVHGGSAASRFAALAITTLVLIVIGRDLFEHPRITARTLLGAIAFYLVIGLVFARAYGFLASVDSGRFFAQPGNNSSADYLYFSYTTQTTVGFGDLSAGTRVGRAFTVAEALVGQLYLVTVFGLFVGNIGRERRPPTEEG